MHVREATADDARAIAQAQVLTWQTAYRGQIPDDHLDGLSVPDRASHWRALLLDTRLPWSGVYVGVDGDRVAGFVHFGPSRDADAGPGTGEVGALYVLPDHWSEGLGRTLLEAARWSLEVARCSEATLWVLETNAAARRFYDQGGWSADGAVRDEERGGAVQHELRYRRRLG